MLLIFVIVLIIIFAYCCLEIKNKEHFYGCDPTQQYDNLEPVIAGDSIKECILNCKNHKDIQANCSIEDVHLTNLTSEIKGFDDKMDSNGKVMLNKEYTQNKNNVINECLRDKNLCKINNEYNPCLAKCVQCKHPIKCNWRYELVDGINTQISGGKLPKKQQCDKTAIDSDKDTIKLYGVIVNNNPPKVKLLWEMDAVKWGTDKKKCGNVYNKTFTVLVFKKIDISNLDNVRTPEKLEEIYIRKETIEDIKPIESFGGDVKFTYDLNKLHDEHLSTEEDGTYIISLQFKDEHERIYTSNSIEVKLSKTRHLYEENSFNTNANDSKTGLLNTILGKTFEINL